MTAGRSSLWYPLLAAGALLTSCASVPRPDLARLYADTKTAVDQAPVVVVPGILGSRLRNRRSGREVWPGTTLDVLFGDHSRLALPIDPVTLEPIDDGVEAYDVFDQLLGSDYYGNLLKTLETYGHFRRTAAGTAVHDRGRRYYVLAYDWRQDNVVTVRELDALIEQIRADYADPTLRVDIVAHSMGGLIVRYFLRYGTQDVLDGNELPINYAGTRKVRTAILLGTPNLGSVRSLHSFIVGEPVGFSRFEPEVLATAPSTYQLFPHPLLDWLISPDGRTLDRDVFDPAIWRAFQWSVYDPAVLERLRKQMPAPGEAERHLDVLQRYFDKRLDRARRFVWALTRQLEASPERIVVFGGDCSPTPARLLVEEIDGESVVRLHPQDVVTRTPNTRYADLMIEPGDGLVTKPSLLGRERLDPTVARHPYAFFPMAYSMLLCEAHHHLTGNVSFQNNLLDVLLSSDRPFDQGAALWAPALP